MRRIVIADPLEPEVVTAITALGEVVYLPPDLPTALSEANVLIVRSATKVTSTLLENAPRLTLVARPGVGVDNIDLAACAERGIKVINTPGASTNAVAELTIACILNVLRHVPRAHLLMKKNIWAKKNLVGAEAAGKTLGLIGLGRIGGAVAQKAHGLGMKILAYQRTQRSAPNVTLLPWNDLLARADIISLHASLDEQSRHCINAASIAQMKQGVYLINLARGELVEENALYEACRSGHIAAAALDVFKTEPYQGKLLELDNVYVTPHIGASTKEAQLRLGTELISQLKSALAHEATKE